MSPTFQTVRPAERMLVVEDAQQRVLDEVSVLGTERVPLTESLGRILREDIVAPTDVPQADNTAMDGYAVRSADVSGASEERPVVLQVIEDLPAGQVPEAEILEGTASRIMTGAYLPRGADAVVPVELTDAGSTVVGIHRAVPAGVNIRRRGEDMHEGDIVIASGTRLSPAEVGVLASTHQSRVLVGVRPTVAIISTGDEIIDVDDPPSFGKVTNSNAYSLAALTVETGAVPRIMGIVKDTREATMAAIESSLESDFILSSGGVSAGAYDFVKDALDALGAETKFWQVAMKPGKPLVLSRLRGKLYFGLPGNPVSCMVSFLLFVAPAIRKGMGQTSQLFPATVRMRIDGELRSKGDRRMYQRVRVVSRNSELVAIPMARQGSGVSTSMVGANGFAVVEQGATLVPSGSIVPTVIFGPIQND